MPTDTVLAQTLNDFFEKRPAVTVLGFSREVGCCRYTIDLIRKEQIGASKDMRNRIMWTMEKYGYKVQ
jgi:hypothetical protein